MKQFIFALALLLQITPLYSMNESKPAPTPQKIFIKDASGRTYGFDITHIQQPSFAIGNTVTMGYDDQHGAHHQNNRNCHSNPIIKPSLRNFMKNSLSCSHL